MKKRPIIFCPEMVRAILAGKKTQTRRVVTPYNSEVGEGGVDWAKFCWDGSQTYRDTCRHGHTEEHKAPLPFVDGRANEYYPYEHQYIHVPFNWAENMTIFRIYPKYEVGDILWVKETWATESRYNSLGPSEVPDTAKIYYVDRAIHKAGGYSLFTEMGKIRPSLFMCEWMARVMLEVIGVRGERLLEITETDAIAEGVIRYPKKIKPGRLYKALKDYEHEAPPLKWWFKAGCLLRADYPSLGHARFHAMDDRLGDKLVIMGKEVFDNYLEDVGLTYVEGFINLWDFLNAKRGYGSEANPWAWVRDFKVVK